jgi:hypothetical protein
MGTLPPHPPGTTEFAVTPDGEVILTVYDFDADTVRRELVLELAPRAIEAR